MRTGFAQLPLHGGKAPAWLFSRMVRLSREVMGHVVAEYGADEVLRRLSDPYWFQAFGCVLGFDWHSSGVTTTVTVALKAGIRRHERDLRGDARGAVLNLVASDSASAREASTELAARPPEETLSALRTVPNLVLPGHHDVRGADIDPRYLHRILLRTYERDPADFESLLGIEGVGAKTLRALALAAELIYGARASTRDPARFSFAHGGKDGHPYPVDRETYDKTIEVLGAAVKRARVDRSEQVNALKRLAAWAERRPGQDAPGPTA